MISRLPAATSRCRVGSSGAGRFPAGTTFNFKKLSMQSGRSLTITSTATGVIRVNTTSFYAGSNLTITNTGTTPALTVADSFGALYVSGTFTVTGNVAITATSLYANSTTATTAISNTTATAVAHSLGQVYARGPLSVSDRASLTTSSLWAASTTTLGNTTPTAVAHSLGQVYAGGAMSVTDLASLTTTSVLANSSGIINNTTATPTSASLGNIRTVGSIQRIGSRDPDHHCSLLRFERDARERRCRGRRQPRSHLRGGRPGRVGQRERFGALLPLRRRRRRLHWPHHRHHYQEFGLIYTSGTTKTLTFSGNVQIHATSVVANGNFTISGATIPTVKHWLGQVFVAAYSSSSNPSANHGDRQLEWHRVGDVERLLPTVRLRPLMPRSLSRCGWGATSNGTATYDDEYGNDLGARQLRHQRRVRHGRDAEVHGALPASLHH